MERAIAACRSSSLSSLSSLLTLSSFWRVTSSTMAYIYIYIYSMARYDSFFGRYDRTMETEEDIRWGERGEEGDDDVILV